MQKSISFLIPLFIISQIAFGQKKLSKIDSLNSNEEVEKLIHSFGKEYESFTLKNIDEFKSKIASIDYCKRIADSLNITNPFYKADFDNNGFTDILAIGDYYQYFNIFIVMNYRQDSYKLNRLTRSSFQECTFPKIINDTIIRYYYMSSPGWRQKWEPSLQQNDLVFKFRDFVELNPSPKVYQVESIEFQTTGCFGTCPIFNIKINRNKTAIFKAERYNEDPITSKEIKGRFKTTLKDSSFFGNYRFA